MSEQKWGILFNGSENVVGFVCIAQKVEGLYVRGVVGVLFFYCCASRRISLLSVNRLLCAIILCCSG